MTGDGKLALLERFYTVQGEGRNAGRAALFVRFAGCNLDCEFADGSRCDTPWQKAREKVTVEDVAGWALEQTGDPIHLELEDAPMAVLTGGEPTMAPGFDRLAERLHDIGYYVAVETNGTRWTDGLEWCHWVTVSPKDRVAHGSPLDDPAPRPDVMVWADEIRLVVTGPGWVLPEWSAWPPQGAELYLSPAMLADGRGMEHEDGTPGWAPGALERALELVRTDPRWRLSLQTHKWIGVR